MSEDPSIAQFVRPGPTQRFPAVVSAAGFPVPEGKFGYLVPDDKAGFLCTFKIGKTHIRIIAGSRQMRVPITVEAGDGPCVKFPVLAPVASPVVKAPQPVPQEEIPPKFFFHTPTFPEPLVLVLPPVPAPIAAPAPPASAAGARKEEEEAQFEEQGDEGQQEARAFVLSNHRDEAAANQAWLMLVSFGLMGMVGAMGAALISRRRPDYIYVRSRR